MAADCGGYAKTEGEKREDGDRGPRNQRWRWSGGLFVRLPEPHELQGMGDPREGFISATVSSAQWEA